MFEFLVKVFAFSSHSDAAQVITHDSDQNNDHVTQEIINSSENWLASLCHQKPESLFGSHRASRK